ncbi:MAG: metal ABC transporter ATP-binding protein [Pseudanabaenaceae cyanobacterium]
MQVEPSFDQVPFDNSGEGNPPLLRVENLTIDRGHCRVVEGVSFQLPQGSHTAIIGPNGAGKSSLIQAILGLIPCRGRLEWLGNPVIGYIPQKLPVLRSFPLSVVEMVALACSCSGKLCKQRVREALHTVGLDQKAHRPIGVLSGGELKRMLLAYCLVLQPQFLVLDEALAGVDRAGAVAFTELLQKLRTVYNWTILQVSHDLQLIREQVDWVIGINRSVIFMGKPGQVLQGDYLQRLYG